MLLRDTRNIQKKRVNNFMCSSWRVWYVIIFRLMNCFPPSRAPPFYATETNSSVMETTFLCQCKLPPPSSRLITSVQIPALPNSHLPPPLQQPPSFVTKRIFVTTCLRPKNFSFVQQEPSSITSSFYLRHSKHFPTPQKKTSYSVIESFLFYRGENLPPQVGHRPRQLTTLLRQSPGSFVISPTSSTMSTAIRRQMVIHSPRTTHYDHSCKLWQPLPIFLELPCKWASLHVHFLWAFSFLRKTMLADILEKQRFLVNILTCNGRSETLLQLYCFQKFIRCILFRTFLLLRHGDSELIRTCVFWCPSSLTKIFNVHSNLKLVLQSTVI